MSRSHVRWVGWSLSLVALSALAVTACGGDDAVAAFSAAGGTGGGGKSASAGEAGAAGTTAEAGQAGEVGSAGSGAVEEPVPPGACDETSTCDAPIELEVVDGDSGVTGSVKSVKASKPGWYRINVRETSVPICTIPVICELHPGKALVLGVVLASPEGVNYDFEYFRYFARDGVGSTCTGAPLGASVEKSDNTDGAIVSWGEGGTDNLSDDTASVLVHVKLADPTQCNPNKEYTLTFQGTPDGGSNCSFYVCP